jgi:hypothetical protein
MKVFILNSAFVLMFAGSGLFFRHATTAHATVPRHL